MSGQCLVGVGTWRVGRRTSLRFSTPSERPTSPAPPHLVNKQWYNTTVIVLDRTTLPNNNNNNTLLPYVPSMKEGQTVVLCVANTGTSPIRRSDTMESITIIHFVSLIKECSNGHKLTLPVRVGSIKSFHKSGRYETN